MMLSWQTLTLSLAMVFFYLQATCQRILRRQFERDYFQSIVNATGLQFPSLRKSLEEFGARADYPSLRIMLKCDFLALTYLLKNVANANQHYSHQERLLLLYFRWQLLSLAVRRVLKVGERKAILRLTSVLQYFANVIGQRVNPVALGSLAAADHLFFNS